MICEEMNLLLKERSISAPSVKLATVDVPGSDGMLDFTEYFGEPKYNNRTVEMLFLSFTSWQSFMFQDSTVKNLLHGKRKKITFEEDSNFYWEGRVFVGDWEDFNSVGRLKITADVFPYKYKKDLTVVTKSIDTTEGLEINLSNLSKTVFPKISTTNPITMVWGDHTVNLSAGNDIIVDGFKLTAGDNLVTLKGTSDVTFKYQEGSL